MSGETLQRKVTVGNPAGFHLRPISAFARRAGQFEGPVWIGKGDQRVNGKSAWEMMLLAAVAGTELVIEASGPGAEALVDELAQIVAAPSWDEDQPSPPKE